MSWQEFEHKVADLFRLLGYRVQSDTRIQGGQTDVLALSDNRFKPNILVECKFHQSEQGKVPIDEVENFAARVVRLRAEGRIDQGYLVTNTGFTSHAKASLAESVDGRFVFLYTYHELMNRLIDTEFYLQEYVRRYEESGAADAFVELWMLEAGIPLRLEFDASPYSVTIRTYDQPKEGNDALPQLVAYLPTHELDTIIARDPDSPTIKLGDLPEAVKASLYAAVPKIKGHRNVTYGVDRLVPAIEYVDTFLETESRRMLMILGDFGSGKTTTLKHLMYLLAKRKLANPADVTVRTPFFVQLRNYNKVVDFDSLIVNFLNTEVGVDKVSLPLFRRLNELGQFILIFDGFDEMARLVSSVERKLTFQAIAEQITVRNKIILSGRPSYFPDNEELVAVVTKSLRSAGSTMGTFAGKASDLGLQIACLQLMDEDQLAAYLKRSLDGRPADTATAIEKLLSHSDIADLARRPVLTNMITESAHELRGLPAQDITLRRLYDIYTKLWTDREENKGFFRVLIDAERKSDFLGLLALQMYFTDTLSVHYTNLDDRIQEHFGLEESKSVDHFSHDIRTCSFLIRDDEGNYAFLHKSFLEYFVGLEYSRGTRSVWRSSFERPLTREVAAFVNYEGVAIGGRILHRLKIGIPEVKDQAIRDQDFEAAAEVRDVERALERTHAEEYWPDFKTEDLKPVVTGALRSLGSAGWGYVSSNAHLLVRTQEEVDFFNECLNLAGRSHTIEL